MINIDNQMKKTYQNESNDSLSLDISDFSYDNPEMIESSEIIYVYLFMPRVRIIHAKLKTKSPLLILDRCIGPNSIYLYKGMILDKKQKISKLNIIQESTIITFSTTNLIPTDNFLDKWKRISSDENFHNQVKMHANQKNIQEIARIRDIKMKRNEIKKKRFGHSLFNFSLISNRKTDFATNTNSDGKKLIIDYPKLAEPSCNPLPILWGE